MIRELKELVLKNSKNVDPEKGKYDCPNCQSTGIVPSDLGLPDVCWSCKGHGVKNWVDNATKQPRKDINKLTEKYVEINKLITCLIYSRKILKSFGIDILFKYYPSNQANITEVSIFSKIREILKRHNL